MCYMLLHDQKFLGQILPRIPVLVMRDLETKLKPYADAGRAKMGQRDHFKYVTLANRSRLRKQQDSNITSFGLTIYIGKTVLITRTEEGEEEIVAGIEAIGTKVVTIGTVIEALGLGTALDQETVVVEMTDGAAAAVVDMMTTAMADHPVIVATAGVQIVTTIATEEMTIVVEVVVAAPPDVKRFFSSLIADVLNWNKAGKHANTRFFLVFLDKYLHEIIIRLFINCFASFVQYPRSISSILGTGSVLET